MPPKREFVGQITDLCTQLRRNLSNYGDHQILSELIQNADDAHASRVSFILDYRTHSNAKTIGGRVNDLHGPALLAFNDAVFSEADYRGLFAFGQGSKRGIPTSTGRFGLGFNSTYHITDVPMLCCGDQITILDPQRTYVPGLEANPTAPPGMKLSITSENPADVADFLGLFAAPAAAAEAAVEADPATLPIVRAGALSGTLFRFPLRTPQQALTSKLSTRPITMESIRELFDKLLRDGSETLLFLQHVYSIALFVWPDGQPPQRLAAIRAVVNPSILAARCVLSKSIGDLLRAYPDGRKVADGKAVPHIASTVDRRSLPRVPYTLTIETTTQRGQTTVEEFLVVLGVGVGTSLDFAAAHFVVDNALWPSVGVAARIASSCGGGGPVLGRLFMGLPLPVESGFPVHVSGRWCLADSRRSLVTGSQPSEKQLVAWNAVLMSDAVADVWSDLILHLSRQMLQSARHSSAALFYSLWPTLRPAAAPSADTPFDSVLPAFYAKMMSQPSVRVLTLDGSVRFAPYGTCRNVRSLRASPELSLDSASEFTPGDRALWLRLVLSNELNREWIAMRRAGKSTVALSLRRRWVRAAKRLIWWMRATGNLSISFPKLGMDKLVDVPSVIVSTIQAIPNIAPLLDLDPPAVRGFLLSNASVIRTARLSLELSTGLLRYCLRGLTSSEELTGLPLLPLWSRDVTFFQPSGPPVFLAPLFAVLSKLVNDTSLVHPWATSLLCASLVCLGNQNTTINQVLACEPFRLLPKLSIAASVCGLNLLPLPSESCHFDAVRLFWTYVKWYYEKIQHHGVFMKLPKMSYDISLCNEAAVIPVLRWSEPGSDDRGGCLCTFGISSALLDCVIAPEADDIATVMRDTQNCGIVGLVLRLGVLVPLPSLPLKDFIPSRSLSPLSVIDVLTSVQQSSELEFRGHLLNGEDTVLLLGYLATALRQLETSPHSLEKLRLLPFFELESGQFVALDALKCAARTIPAGIPRSELQTEEIAILKNKPALADLYAMLGVLPLDELELYEKHIFPRFTTLPFLDRCAHIQRVLFQMDSLKEHRPTFPDLISRIPMVDMPDGSVRAVGDLYDPKVSRIASLFPDLCVPESVREHLPLLRQAGLMSHISQEGFLSIASHLAATSQDVTPAIRAKANTLLEYLALYYADLTSGSDRDDDEFYTIIGELPIAPVKAPPLHRLEEELQTKTLRPLLRVVTEVNGPLAWSQCPVLDLQSRLPLPRHLLVLWGLQSPPVEVVIAHLKFLTQLSPEEVASLSPTSSFSSDISNIYSELSSAVSAGNKEVRGRIKSLLQFNWIYIPRRAKFVDGSVMFRYLDYSISPFAYDLTDCPSGLWQMSGSFLTSLGITERPTPEYLIDVLTKVNSQFGDSPLDAPTFSSIIRVLRLYVSLLLPGGPVDRRLLAPDTKHVLRPCSQLFRADSPWLQNRVDMSKVAVIDSSLLDIAVDIGVASMSTVIVESMYPGFVPEVAPIPAEFRRWNRNLSSVEMRVALTQVLREDKNMNSSSEPRVSFGEVCKRLYDLHDLELVPCSTLQSAFYIGDTDITAPNGRHGSYHLCQVSSNGHLRLFIVTSTPPNNWASCIAMGLQKWIFGGVPENLLPVVQLLDSDLGDIPNVLQFLRIPQIPVSEHLGLVLSQRAANRLAQPQNPQELSRGEEIAWVDGGQFRYGRIVSTMNDNSAFTVDVSPKSTLKIPFSSIWKLRASSRDQIAAYSADDAVDQPEVQLPSSELSEEEVLSSPGGMPAETVAILNSTRSSVERTAYTPPSTDWWDKEEKVLEDLQVSSDRLLTQLEPEPSGVDELLMNGDTVAVANRKRAQLADVKISTDVRRGYDLVRWGSLDNGIAFFNARTIPLTDQRLQLLKMSSRVLQEVCAVFDFDPRYVTLFYQPNALSRFIKQKLMYNIWPIEEHLKANNLSDPANDPFAYCYFYGLCIHKIAHFHEIIHGTRHDYYMNEIRIEFAEAWLDLLDRHGFDPLSVLNGPYGSKMLLQVVF